MAQQEHWFSYGGGEAEFPDTRREESLRWLSHGTDLSVFHSLYPQPNTTDPFLPEFGPSSQFGYIAENSSMFRYELQDLNPLASSDRPMPLWRSSWQSNASTSCDSVPSLVASELWDSPWRQNLRLRLQEHELQPQIDQVVNRSPFHPVPEAGLQMEMELPSNQSYHGIMNTLLGADQQIMMEQIVGMNHLSSFQLDAARNQTVIIISESAQISRSNCGASVIDGSQRENTDCSIDGVLGNHRTGKRIRTFEDVTEPFDGSTLSLGRSPSVCTGALPLQTMPIQQVSEFSVAKKQKTETGGSEASASSPKALPFYNFVGLPHDIYVAQRDAIPNRSNNSWKTIMMLMLI